MIFRGSLTSLVVCLLTVPNLLAQERTVNPPNNTSGFQPELKGPKPPSPSTITPAEVRIFTLKHTDAIEATQTLRELFEGLDNAKLRIVYHRSTNSVIARGNDGDLEVIETILNRLDVVSEEKAKSKTENNIPQTRSQRPIEELRDRLPIAQADVEHWKERVAWSDRMVKKGYVSATQAQADRSRLASSEATLEKIQKQLESLSSDAKKGSEKEKKPQK